MIAGALKLFSVCNRNLECFYIQIPWPHLQGLFGGVTEGHIFFIIAAWPDHGKIQTAGGDHEPLETAGEETMLLREPS